MNYSLRSLLDEVIKRNASDLHIGVGEAPAMRVGGHLDYVEGADPMSYAEVEAAFLEVISQAQFKKFAASGELDFSFLHKGSNGLDARFRGNCYRESRGMAAAFRLIPLQIRTFDELRLPSTLREVAGRRRGFFLVTGPTGHGKSTTLAAVVNEINSTRNDHIITIEDPIEYVHKSKKCLVHQREVGTDTASFSSGLKYALRQDPDVIMLGELRDLETIAAAITAAETGHLVLGTLHTQDAAQSIDRLIDVFPPHQQTQIRIQVASVLVGICSQQLIPKGDGQRACATELLLSNPAVRNCILEGKTNQIRDLIQTGSLAGMHTMEQCLADMVSQGVLPLDTALAYAYDAKELQRVLARDK